jgi:hypothetical protein
LLSVLSSSSDYSLKLSLGQRLFFNESGIQHF